MNISLQATTPHGQMPARHRLTSSNARDARQPPRSGAMSVVIVHDEAALAAYLPAWDALAAAAIEPNPFYESWMLLPALHSFATGQAIQFVLIFTPDPERPHAAPLLCGFFPLQPHRLYKGLPVPNVRLWQHRHCFSCTPLLRTEFARECLLAFFNWLAAGSRCGVLLEMPL